MKKIKDKYIILELIPTSSIPENGLIAQIQALKIENEKIIDRFDYRINNKYINNEDIINMINYDNNMFIYKENNNEIINDLKIFIEDYDILYLSEEFTMKYLESIKNKKEQVYNYIDIVNNYDVINNLIKKYNLEPSNHLVDLIYESIIKQK